MDFIYSLLEDGPKRSSYLVQKLIEKESIKPDTARKRLTRLKTPIKSLKNFNLSNKEKIFYLDEQFGTALFFDDISQILMSTNTAAGRALSALNTKKGVLPEYIFAKTSGLAVGFSKKHVHHTKVIEQLKSIGLVHTVPDDKYKRLICRYDKDDIPSLQRATFEVEDIVLSIIKKWIINLGMSSSNTLKIREDTAPQYGFFEWDFVGPCYLNPIVRYKNGKIQNGFIVGDIILNKTITLRDLKQFFYKFDSLNNQRKIQPFLALLVSDYFEEDALQKLRAKGVIIARPKTVLGEENANLLSTLIKSIENASTMIKENPDSLFDMFKRLNKIEGAAYNLRSVVFDFIIARIYSIEGFSCELRKKIQIVKNKQVERVEIDVIASREDRKVCIEGKGLAPGNNVDIEEIKKWNKKSLPRLMYWLKKDDTVSGEKIIEFYSSTNYEDNAIPLIKEIEKKNKKIKVKFYNGQDIVSKLRQFGQTSLVEIYNEHFK